MRTLLIIGRLAIALLLCVWTVHAVHWYSTLPRRASARICGNCFMAAVGVPVEAGFVGLILLSQMALLRTVDIHTFRVYSSSVETLNHLQAMSKRINIVLPDTTLAVLDRIAPKGNRSQLISRAVLHFVASQGKEALRRRLKEEALANSARDIALAADWFPLEEEATSIPATAAKRNSRARKTKAT